MQTITKKELIDRIAEKSSHKRVVVKRIIQSFLQVRISIGPARTVIRPGGVTVYVDRLRRACRTQQ